MKLKSFLICFLLAATSAFSSLFAMPVIASRGDYYVNIYDGEKKTIIRISANSTVEDALKIANINFESSDSIEPALSAEINADNFFINIHRSRPVLVIDGTEKKYLMTASYDAKTIAKEAGFVVFDGDEIALAKNPNFLEIGIAASYEITHHGGTTITIEEDIPFSEEIIKDYTMQPGTSSVEQLGELGKKTIVYKVQSINGQEISRELVSETITRSPVPRITRVYAEKVKRKPLTASMGRNRYTIEKEDGTIIERQETYYDLPMSGVMGFCGKTAYTVREDGVKIDDEGYVIIAANLNRYPRCSVVETSLGLGKVYDTGGFAQKNPEQFDIATDWTNHNGR